MRALYTLLWVVALPWLPLRLWWRGRREPGYRQRIGERFGRYGDASPRRSGADVIWIHAVSLGETRAAAPLVARIARDLPAATILLTHMTATGTRGGPRAVRQRRRAGVASVRRSVRRPRVPRALFVRAPGC